MPSHPTRQRGTTRWELIRDVAVFQLKVGVDALRDITLVPVSLVAGVIDLISGGERPGRLFYDVMDVGRRSETWINLFGEHTRNDEGLTEGAPEAPSPTVDTVVARLEGLIVEQFERGGVTAAAKDAIDRSLDAFSSSDARDQSTRSQPTLPQEGGRAKPAG